MLRRKIKVPTLMAVGMWQAQITNTVGRRTGPKAVLLTQISYNYYWKVLEEYDDGLGA